MGSLAQMNSATLTNEKFLTAISSLTSPGRYVGRSRRNLKQNFTSDSKITTVESATSNVKTRLNAIHWEDRTLLSDVYDAPLTDRESWWRNDLKVTPVPGAYDTPDFVSEILKKPRSYAFKDQGRKGFYLADSGKGALLLPGAYKHADFLENLSKKTATYQFKAEARDAKDYLNFGVKDKEINIPPNAYKVENYLAVDGENAPVKSSMFKSQTKRFPTYIFRPKEGPSPNAYNVKDTAPVLPPVTSCFRSKTPRFQTVHSKVPDPGMYARTFQHPMPKTISQLGRQHGLFFTSEFQI